jgi:SAM-dependent methyltransferase
VYPLDLGWDGLMYGRSLGVQRMTQGDIQTLPFRNGAFDAVFSMDVIVHMALGDEEKPMREFHRVLCAGGFLAVRVSALDVLRSRHSEFAMERQRFTRSRLVKLAENCGFRVTRCTYANTFLLPVAFTKFRIVEPLLRTKPESGVKPVSPALDAILHAPLAWEAELIGSGVNFPAGQSLILLAERR